MKTKLIGLLASLFVLVSSAWGQNPGRVVNLSTRLRSGPGSATPIVGWSIKAGPEKLVLARAVGPGLVAFGIPAGGIMVDPVLVLNDSAGREIFRNDNWEVQPGFGLAEYRVNILGAAARSGAFPLADGSKDASVLKSLAPGNYTVMCLPKDQSVANGYGSMIFELYEVNDAVNRQSPQFANLSTRGFVGVGSDVLIMGVSIGGQTAIPILVRAVGPTLSLFGLTDLLADPVITVKNGRGEIMNSTGLFVPAATNAVTNDDWVNDGTVAATSATVGAFALPVGSKDAAAVIMLPPGNYTVTVSGKNNGTGNALAEIYIP